MKFKSSITAAVLGLVVAADNATAQRTTERVPFFLAVSFSSPGESKLGVDIAEAVRVRMLRQFPMPPVRTLRVLTRTEINNTLTVSGYAADTAISVTDLGILGRQMGAAETMDGTAKRTAAGIEARAKFYLNNNMAAPEVLPVVTDKTPEAVGRKLAELYIQARKELPAYERCRNALIQNQPDQAIAAAKEALIEYPQGVLGRACLLTAYGAQYKNYGPDSILRLGNEIIAIDPENTIAIGQLADAYRAKNDTAKAVALIAKLDSLILNDLPQSQSLIDILMSLGAPAPALGIIQRRLLENPGEVALLERKWKILQSTNQWKQAIAAGDEMVKFDSAKADTIYFFRQVGAALKDSQPALALQYLARGTAKFPNNVELHRAYSQELRRQGQLQQALEVAKKVVALDPKADQGYATIVFLYTQLGQGDSAVAIAKTALVSADSSTRDQIGKGLATLIAPGLTKAQADTSSPPDVQRANWQEVYKLAAAVDSIVPQPQTAFLMSFSAFNLAMNALNRIQGLAQARNNAGACAELRNASDMVLVVDLNMARGGRFNPSAAGNILTALSGTVKPYLESTRGQLRCR
jgi:tetratricopeptide (TPR) repeat protein